MKFFNRQELIILGLIFLVLTVIAFPNFSLSVKKSRDLTRKDDLFALEIALKDYEKQNESFPLALSDLPINPIPTDPLLKNGDKYLYFSNGKRFQLYASLELTDQDEYDEKVASRNLLCGTRVCNFGRAYGDTPLDISIEEYENKLLYEE